MAKNVARSSPAAYSLTLSQQSNMSRTYRSQRRSGIHGLGLDVGAQFGPHGALHHEIDPPAE